MIVLKFGGSSLSSANNIRRVTSIVSSQIQSQPIVVVSALGETTDQLVELLEIAQRGESCLLCKRHRELSEYHAGILDDLFASGAPAELEEYTRKLFRDLHVRLLEICEDGLPAAPALRDEVLSVGEQISSRIVAAGLAQAGLDTRHMDGRELILTDHHFTNAKPLYWESFARIRWTVPQTAKTQTVVLGGFIGSTDTGRTTTLGRGGSDLTASMIAAAINAKELQVWKDVDGMLTCDPRLKPDAYRVKELSYEEAAELARAGATILHPDSIAPARRLRIPVVIKNTFAPDGEGTKITPIPAEPANRPKSIACKRDLTILEIHPLFAGMDLTALSEAFRELAVSTGAKPELLNVSENSIYLQIDRKADYHQIQFPLQRCLQVRIRAHQAIITVVGSRIGEDDALVTRVRSLFKEDYVTILTDELVSCCFRMIVPERTLISFLDRLHAALFNNLDFALFTTQTSSEAPERVCVSKDQKAGKKPGRLVAMERRFLLS